MRSFAGLFKSITPKKASGFFGFMSLTLLIILVIQMTTPDKIVTEEVKSTVYLPFISNHSNTAVYPAPGEESISYPYPYPL